MSGLEPNQWNADFSNSNMFSMPGQMSIVGAENNVAWPGPRTPFNNSSTSNLSSTNMFSTSSIGHSTKFGVDERLVLRILSQATDEDLICARNPAYMTLFTKENKMQGQIDSQMSFINSLLHSRATISVATGPSPQQDVSECLFIPKAPSACGRDDYDKVGYWTKAEWKKHTNDCMVRNKEYGKLDFITDEDGDEVDEDRMKAMSAKARELFTTLYRYRQDPQSWGLRGAEASQFFSNTMRVEFPEFRWCENDWKVHSFATGRYPDWVRDVRNGGNLTRARPSIHQAAPKRKADEGELSEKKKKKQKKSRTTQPPPNTDVIEISDVAPASSTTNQIAHPRPSARPVTSSVQTGFVEPNPVPTLVATPGSTASNSAITQGDNVANASEQPQTATTTFPPSDARVIPPSMSSTLGSTFAPSLRTAAVTLLTPDRIVTPSASNSDIADARLESSGSTTTAVTPSASNSDIADARLASSESTATAVAPSTSTPILSRQSSNLFGDLSIPRPTNEVPQVAAVPIAAPSKPAKKAKPMVPGKAISARNLFAIDYLKDHPTTTNGEFKKVFDNLEESIKKRYEKLCKQRKAEDAQAKKTSTK